MTKDNELPIKDYVVYRNNDARMREGLMPTADGTGYIALFRYDMGLLLTITEGADMPTIKLNTRRLKDKKGKRRYCLVVEEM